VGDPYKDTTSVAMNPIIKFSTLFGLLAVEIAIHLKLKAKGWLDVQGNFTAHESNVAEKIAQTFDFTPIIGLFFLIVGLIFVYRSFYGMRIKK
jgi:K(+)-stimulated pyrophosphate-energized sodium pump